MTGWCDAECGLRLVLRDVLRAEAIMGWAPPIMAPVPHHRSSRKDAQEHSSEPHTEATLLFPSCLPAVADALPML